MIYSKHVATPLCNLLFHSDETERQGVLHARGSVPEERLRGGQSDVVVVDEDLAEDGRRAQQQRDQLTQQDRLPNVAAKWKFDLYQYK